MSDPDETMKRALQEAQDAYRGGGHERAAELATRALTSPGDAETRCALLLLLAAACDELGRYEHALAALKNALELDPDSVSAWNNLGIICRKIGKMDEAHAAFEQAYRRDPGNAGVLISLGSIALKRSDPAEAKRLLELALEIDPSHPIAHANLALTLAVFGRLEEAEESLRLAVLHGFDRGEEIQQRLDRMKEVRERILRSQAPAAGTAGVDAAGPAGETDAERAEVLELLGLLERELRRLAAQPAAGPSAGPAADANERERAERLRTLRVQIDALRASLGLPVEADAGTGGGRDVGTEDQQ